VYRAVLSVFWSCIKLFFDHGLCGTFSSSENVAWKPCFEGLLGGYFKPDVACQALYGVAACWRGTV
jgi:hypothetical protein